MSEQNSIQNNTDFDKDKVDKYLSSLCDEIISHELFLKIMKDTEEFSQKEKFYLSITLPSLFRGLK